MASYNKVILMGNLTRDPELKHSKSGVPVCNLTLAVNEKSKAGESTVFADVTLFNRTAEICCEYLNKGSPALIEGRLKLDQWTDTNGQKRSKLTVTGDKLVMLGGRTGNHEDNGHANPDAYNDDKPADDSPF